MRPIKDIIALEDLGDHCPTELSGGMRSRAASNDR